MAHTHSEVVIIIIPLLRNYVIKWLHKKCNVFKCTLHSYSYTSLFSLVRKQKVCLECYLTMTVSLNLPHSYNISRDKVDIAQEIFQISTRYSNIIDLILTTNGKSLYSYFYITIHYVKFLRYMTKIQDDNTKNKTKVQ